ncbi:hypothetical protein ACROYT_G035186 [Oculina patagonica]
MYDLLTMRKTGVNWAKCLPEYARALNQEVKEELSWKSAFEVYYGRKPFRKDELSEATTAQEWNVENEAYEEMISSRPKDYESHDIPVNRIRKAASVATGSSKTLTKLISVNDMTSTTIDKEKRKRKLACQSSKKMHKKKYLIPFSNHREKFTDMQSEMNFLISYDPPKDGNCQFSALCHELVNIGVFRSAETLRKEIVSFLESHPNSPDGTPLELFAGIPWSQYLRSMVRNGTHGDHFTLQAAADIFNIQIVVYSTLGSTATQTISPTNGCPIATFYLGHFAERAGEHYVCLADETISDRSDTEYNCLSPVQDEQSDLGSRSGLNAPGDQSQSDADQYAPDINTTHGNRTRLHENEEQDTNNQCGYEQQFNECNADYGADINPDVLEDVTETTGGSSPEMRSSEPPYTEYNCVPPIQDEQSELDGADQSHTKTDRHAPDVNTAHGDRTGLHENEEQDTNNECGYEEQENAHASQSNGCNTDYGSFLNPDVLENITETTVGRYPHMRQTLGAVSRFFKRIVDNVPSPQIYLPELADVADIHHLSVRKIINIKGKNSGAVIALKHIINAKNWTNAWVRFVAYGYGWYGISKIYWRTRN